MRHSFQTMSPRLDAEAQLLVLLARSELSETQIRLLRLIVPAVRDWEYVTQAAIGKFAAPFVYDALKRYAADLTPEASLERLRCAAKHYALRTLRIVAAQTTFHKTCIQPINADHAYIKGVAISQQFDRNITDRFCRDVDVLVAQEHITQVVRLAAQAGYRVLVQEEPQRFAESQDEIEFAAKFENVVTLVGKDEIGIEVHRRLGKHGLTFDLRRALKTSETIEISSIEMRTLNKPLHFVYACYHHGRHYWSHLHWLADIDAIIQDESVTRTQVNEIADEIGIRPTMDAVFDFHQLTADPRLWSSADFSSDHGAQLLKACLINLTGGLELEKEIRQDRTFGEFIMPWQVSQSHSNAMFRNFGLRRLKPNISQYIAFPLPPILHWIYRLQNLKTLTKLAIARLTNRSQRNPKSKEEETVYAASDATNRIADVE